MAYEGSQSSICRHCGFGLILSTHQVLSKEAFASATLSITTKGVDKLKKKKKKLLFTWLYFNCYVTLWSYLAFYFFRFFYLR